MHGRGEDDRILGNEGDDYITGDRGRDTLLGEAGNDTIFGNLDDDAIESSPASACRGPLTDNDVSFTAGLYGCGECVRSPAGYCWPD